MAAGTLTQVGNGNTYIQKNDTKMVIEFSRNPKDFMVNRYVQIRTVPKQRGVYLNIDPNEAMRLVAGEINDYVWPDGQPRPEPRRDGQEFNFKDYQTIRRNFGHPIGDIARTEADWDAEDTQEALQAQKAMTARTKLVVDAINTQANWDAAHWKAVSTITGSGAWNAALSTNQYIKRSINAGVNQIRLSTGAKVKKRHLVMVMNPTTAYAIGESQEIVDLVKQSATAYPNLTQESEWDEYGLPSKLYGIPVIVEDTVVVTSPKGASTLVQTSAMPDGAVWLLARVGSLVGRGGGPSFTTVTLFAKEEMTVERKHDDRDRLVNIDIVDDVGVGLTAPVSGFAFRSVLA